MCKLSVYKCPASSDGYRQQQGFFVIFAITLLPFDNFGKLDELPTSPRGYFTLPCETLQHNILTCRSVTLCWISGDADYRIWKGMQESFHQK